MKNITTKKTFLSRTVEFTDLGIQFHYYCPVPLCTYHVQHLFSHEEIAAHKQCYDTSTRQAVLDNYRYFKNKMEKHKHMIWSYEI